MTNFNLNAIRSFFTKWFAAAMLVLLAMTASACMEVEGNGVEGVETRITGNFEGVEVRGDFLVVTEIQEDASSDEIEVTISGDTNLLPFVDTQIEDGKLVVQSIAVLYPQVPLVVEVKVPSLKQVEATEGASVDLSGMSADTFKVLSDGSSHIQMAGFVKDLNVSVNGDAINDIQAIDLVAQGTQVDLKGQGNVSVCATDNLNVAIVGEGKVFYDCDPTEISKSIEGGGAISALN